MQVPAQEQERAYTQWTPQRHTQREDSKYLGDLRGEVAVDHP